MNLDQARNFLRHAAWPGTDGHTQPAQSASLASAHASKTEPRTARAASLCIASGKGGTGKSVITATLARLFAQRERTLIVDADLGVGNAHILQNLAPEHSLADVADGRRGVREVLQSCGPRLDLLAGGSGIPNMAGLSPWELALVATGLESIETEYRYLLVDSAAGISNQTLAFAAACDVLLLVTTSDVTALTDAYAFLKLYLQRRPATAPFLCVNRVESGAEGEQVGARMAAVARKFLGREPRFIGSLPDDRAVTRSVHDRSPVIANEPLSPFARAALALFAEVEHELALVQACGLGRTLLHSAGPAARSSVAG